MAEAVLSLRGLRKRFGGLVATDDLDLDVLPGEFHAIIGPNGAGKTTLVNLVSGLLAPDAGTIVFAGVDVTRSPVHARARLGLARSFQITSVLPGFSAHENVVLALEAHARGASDTALGERATAALAEVGLPTRADVPAAALSHGEKRALELAMALAGEPKLLLLDEPMAGTGHEEAARLVALLRGLKGRFPIVLVEHDMAAVFALADRISVLIYGRVLVSGPPDVVRADPRVVEAYLGDEME